MIRKDESEWYKHPNHHEAIISQELFDKVQARRVKKDYKGRAYHQYPLKGKVMCGHCGHTLHRFDHLKPIYKCDYFSKYDKTEPCYDLGILEEELHELLSALVQLNFHQTRTNRAKNTRKIRANPLMPQGKKRNHVFLGKNNDKNAQPMAVLAKSCASLF